MQFIPSPDLSRWERNLKHHLFALRRGQNSSLSLRERMKVRGSDALQPPARPRDADGRGHSIHPLT